MDAVANVLGTNLAVNRIPRLEEVAFFRPGHPTPSHLRHDRFDAVHQAISHRGLQPQGIGAIPRRCLTDCRIVDTNPLDQSSVYASHSQYTFAAFAEI